MKSRANGDCGGVDFDCDGGCGKVESKIEVREGGEKKERASTNVLFICVICCCWDLQLNWSVGGGEGTFAGIMAIVAKNAGQRAGCREILDFCCFHASTFCVFEQQWLEEILMVFAGRLMCGAEQLCSC